MNLLSGTMNSVVKYLGIVAVFGILFTCAALAQGIDALENEKERKIDELRRVEGVISENQVKLSALNGLASLPAGLRDAAIRQYLINVEGIKPGLVEPALFAFDLDREIRNTRSKIQGAQNRRQQLQTDIANLNRRIDQTIEQDRADEEYFRDPLRADLRNERIHLRNLLEALKRPLDDHDRRDLEWQIQNTRRRIAQLEAQIAERDRQSTQQGTTGPPPPRPAGPQTVVGAGGGFVRVQVPDVTGMSETEALNALRRANLSGQVTQRQNSERMAAGTVLGQGIPAGQWVASGSLVTLIVSRGPRPQTQPQGGRVRLSAQIDCGTSFEIVAGDFMGRDCGIIVRGWRSNTRERVVVDVSFDPRSGIEVTPGDTSESPGNMYTAGVSDTYDRYVFKEGFRASRNAVPNTYMVTITVSQVGAGQVTIPVNVSVLRPGLLPSSGGGIRPPANVSTGSGGVYCVWRYKLIGDPPPCFHFVAAGCNSARYNNPRNGYELVGQDMTFGEADALIGRLSKYFQDEYGCDGSGSDSRPGASTAGSGAGTTPPAKQYGVFVLTNVSGGSIWVGEESQLDKRAVGSFKGGGTCRRLEDGCPKVAYQMQLGPFESLGKANEAYCRSFNKRFCPPLVVSCKAETSFGTYWIASAPGCP